MTGAPSEDCPRHFLPAGFYFPSTFSKLSSVTLYHCILNQTYSKLCTNQNIALHLKVWQLFWGDVQSFSPIWIAADDDNDTVDSETGAYIGGAGVGFSSWLVMAAENRAKFLLTAFIHGHHASVQHLHSHHALARLQLLLLENKYNCLKHQQPHFSDKSTLLDMHCCVVYIEPGFIWWYTAADVCMLGPEQWAVCLAMRSAVIWSDGLSALQN